MRASLDLLLFLCWTGEASPLDDALGFEATQPSVLLQLFAREALANLRLRFAQGRCGQFAASPERPHVAGPRIDSKITEAAFQRRFGEAIVNKKRRTEVSVIVE